MIMLLDIQFPKWQIFILLQTSLIKIDLCEWAKNPQYYNVGGFGVDLIKRSKLLNKKELEKKLSISFNKKIY